jgi:hypothetical protein
MPEMQVHHVDLIYGFLVTMIFSFEDVNMFCKEFLLCVFFS